MTATAASYVIFHDGSDGHATGDDTPVPCLSDALAAQPQRGRGRRPLGAPAPQPGCTLRVC